MRFPMRTLVVLFALMSAAGAQTIDQQYDVPFPGPSAFDLNGGAQNMAMQTFTVGQTGVLSRIEVAVMDQNHVGSLYVQLFNLNNGFNLLSPISTTQFDHSQVPDVPSWLTIELPGQIIVQPGDQFGIHLIAANTGLFQTGWYRWIASTSDSAYPGGTLHVVPPSIFVSPTPLGFDGGFRAYVGNVTVSPASSFSQGFEGTDGLWTAGSGWTFVATGGAVNGGRFARIQSGANGLTSGLFTSPALDFDTVLPNAELSFQYRITDALLGGLIHTLDLEVDRNDGLGFVAIPGGSFNQVTSPGVWTPVTISLPDVGGRTGVRIRAAATVETQIIVVSTLTSEIDLDEISISTPNVVVTPTNPYLCDFESNDEWMSADPTWQKGLPLQSALFGARSGVTAWATGLNTNYAPNTTATLTSPVFELREFTGHATCEFAVNSRLAAGDSLVVLYDRFDGMGPQPLPFGSIVGDSGGWVVRRVDLPLTMGEGGGRLHFEFSSDGMAEDEGVAIDEVRIFQPAYAGSSSREGDDLTMEVFIDGQLEYGVGDSFTMLAGENVTVRSSSGGGSLDGAQYYLIGELYNGPMTFQKAAVDIWFALGGGTFVLDGGAEAPFFVPVGLSPFGETWSFTYPGGAPGWNCLVQAVVVDPLKVQSGFYASTNAFRLQFN
ncbi:MAG: hypothetical protein R3F20_08275 [Planctomycetota bacterium]